MTPSTDSSANNTAKQNDFQKHAFGRVFLRHISPRKYKVSCVGFMIWCPSGRCVAHCTFEIALSQAITLTLLLVCAFSPKVQKYLLGSPVFPLEMTNLLHLGNNVKGTMICAKGTHNILWFFSKTDHNLLFLFIKIC